MRIYRSLYRHFGPQGWWPGDSPIEIIIGAILTQNTNWANVEKAVRNLKAHRCLSPRTLKNIPVSRLARLIRPSGYYNIKAKRIKNFMAFLFGEYRGRLSEIKKIKTEILREQLLGINGIGPETADSILLYAFNRPVFVVDAYTKRLVTRHEILSRLAGYDDIQRVFTENLPRNAKLFNEYHALIVRLGKEYCRVHPRCGECPLKRYLPTGKEV